MSSDVDSLPSASGDFTPPAPPPLPPNCSEEMRYQLECYQWGTNATVGQLQANQQAHKRNHEELMRAIQKVDAKVDKPPPQGPVGRLLSSVLGSTVLKQALATAIAGLITAGVAYWTFKLTGTPTTPTPVDVVPLISPEGDN